MGTGKVEFSERKYKGRTKHSAKINAGNGESLLITPPKQAYFNEADLDNALFKSYLVLHEKYKDRLK